MKTYETLCLRFHVIPVFYWEDFVTSLFTYFHTKRVTTFVITRSLTLIECRRFNS